MSLPPRPPQPLYTDQIVYLRCRVVMPGNLRYEADKRAIVTPCKPTGASFEDAWFFIDHNNVIPKSKLREELA